MRLDCLRGAVAIVLLGSLGRPAVADEFAPETARTAVIAVSGVALVLTAELSPGTFLPAQCRRCDPPGFD